MHRAFADAIIREALEANPDHLRGVMEKVARSLQERGCSTEEIEAAMNALLDELEAPREPAH